MSVAVEPQLSVLREGGRHSSETTIVLPGILARAEVQFYPILPWLPGRVVGFTDNGWYQNHTDYTTAIPFAIKRELWSGRRVNLVGASMGGMRIPFIVERLRQQDNTNLSGLGKIVPIDAPNGADTMKELPNWAAPIVASGAVGRVMSTRFGDWLIAKMAKPPNDDEIDVPDAEHRRFIAGQDVDSDEWASFIQKTALEQLSGWAGSLWWSQVAWMYQVGHNGSLERATRALHGRDVTYITCTHPGNVTIDQPIAADWWGRQARAKIVEVNAVHCGFWQQPEPFAAALAKIFG